ncbi:MAG: hypothetical protein LBV61_00795 [Burkholderiaceae bacterium]|nr:hypothetical protein [Burkholderiaceae bacterium]
MPALAALLLAACTTDAPRFTPGQYTPSALTKNQHPLQAQVFVQPHTTPNCCTWMDADPINQVLTYTNKLRTLNATELAGEISRLNHLSPSPITQLELAAALAQTRASEDLQRALTTVQKVVADSAPQAQQLHPLARLLATHYEERRRAEDENQRQTQQVRDGQKRIDQLNERIEHLNERIEALRTIERSVIRPALPGKAQ